MPARVWRLVHRVLSSRAVRSLQAAVLLVSFGVSSIALGSGSEAQAIGAFLQLSTVSLHITVAVAVAASQHASRSECERDSDCHSSYVCSSAKQCVATRPVSSTRPSSCLDGMVCDAAGTSSLRRQASELYLRERVVALREELALGQGPLITGLASAQGVPARTLGRALRQHRAELVGLIGDGSGAEWSARFLARVDELCGHS